MFVNRTVFILGAGASWHYGYPTGEDLVTAVIAKADYAAAGFGALAGPLKALAQPPSELIRDRVPNWNDLAAQTPAFKKLEEECGDISRRLKQVRPPVIDYFLGHNPNIQEIGKLLIAWVILECEIRDASGRGNENRYLMLENSPYLDDRNRTIQIDKTKFKDNWYRFIVSKIVSDCKTAADLKNNKVTFVTFNYDISLEHHLRSSLNAYDLFQGNPAAEFLGDRVLHVYGGVNEGGREAYNPIPISRNADEFDRDTHEDNSLTKSLRTFQDVLDRVYKASKWTACNEWSGCYFSSKRHVMPSWPGGEA